MTEPVTVARADTDATLLTVVICCFSHERRSQTIAAAQSALDQLGPTDGLIVVVDNNDSLSRDLANTLDSRITIVPNMFEQGLSGARNTGLHWAAGDVLVFLDDDAVLHENSLDRVRQLFAERPLAAVGGAVDAAWHTGAAPSWFPREFGWVVGCDYRGLPGDGEPIRNPIGAAMAVRRDALSVINGFSPELGRVGALPAGCEETLMGVALRRRFPDLEIVRDTTFRVAHHIPANRRTVRYYLRRCYHEGRSKAVLTRISGHQTALSSERRYTTRILPSGLWQARTNPARAAALVAGFAATGFGFLIGTLRQIGVSRTRREVTA